MKNSSKMINYNNNWNSLGEHALINNSSRCNTVSQEYPGLAMYRSIGDVEAKTVGVIPNPQIIEYEINPKSKYMIICSDGIWEFISNEEAMEIGKKYYIRHDPVGLCNELISKSTEIWKVEDEVIDDITVVVVFF